MPETSQQADRSPDLARLIAGPASAATGSLWCTATVRVARYAATPDSDPVSGVAGRSKARARGFAIGR